MNKDLRHEADATYYYGEIRMWLEAREDNNLGIIVEGKFDELLFSKLLNKNIIFFPVDGCINALAVTQNIENSNYNGIITIVDADFRRITNDLATSNICFYTDYHDSEMMMINSRSWNEIIDFFGIKLKVNHFEYIHRMTTKDYLLELIKPIACIRYLNEINNLNLTFKTFTKGKYNFINYKDFINSNDLTIDIDKLFVSIENKSQKQGFFHNNPEIVKDVNTELANSYNPLEFCNGHDILNTLSIALEQVLSNKKSSNKIDHSKLEESLILAFRLEDFQTTTLNSELTIWENNNKPYLIF